MIKKSSSIIFIQTEMDLYMRKELKKTIQFNRMEW